MQAKLNSLFEKEHLWAVIISVGFVWLFASIQPNYLSLFVSADTFVRLGWQLGSLPLPGHPVLLGLINVITHLPLGLAVVKQAYLLAAILGGFSLGGLYLLLGQLEKKQQVSIPAIESSVYRFLVLIVLGLSETYLTQSLVIERYIFVVFILIWSIYLYLKLPDSLWIPILLGLGLAEHWILLPATLWWFTSEIRRRVQIGQLVRKLGMVLGVYVVALGFLSFIQSRSIIHSTIYPANSSELIKSYLGGYFSDSFGLRNPQSSNISLDYFKHALDKAMGEFGILIIFIVIGLLKFLRKDLKKTIIWGFLCTGLLIVPAALYGVSSYTSGQEKISLILIFGFVGLSVVFWYGLVGFIRRMSAGLSVLHSKKIAMIVVMMVVIALVVLTRSKYKQNGFSETSFFDRVGGSVMESISNDSRVICFEDQWCSLLLYRQQVEKKDEDVLIIPYYYHPDFYNLDLTELRRFSYNNHPQIMHELVSEMIHDESKLYFVGNSQQYLEYLGVDFGFVHLLPMGYINQLVLITPKNISEPKYVNIDDVVIKNSNELKNKFLHELVQTHLLNAVVSFKSDLVGRGYNEMNLASGLAYKLGEKEYSNFSAARARQESYTSNPFFVASSTLETVESVLNEVPIFVENGYFGRAIELARGALMLDPNHIEARLTLADLLRQTEQIEMAKIEYENVLKLDPENFKALSGLESF